MSTPAPGAHGQQYGCLFWLNRGGASVYLNETVGRVLDAIATPSSSREQQGDEKRDPPCASGASTARTGRKAAGAEEATEH